MTREEAIKGLKVLRKDFGGYKPNEEMFDMAIEALEREPSEDGTLEVKVEDATKIGRVLIIDDKHSGGLYYPDEDEPKGEDLISRAEAIEAIELVDWYHQNSNKDMVHGANDDEHQAWYKAQDIYKALETVPSADRPRGEWIDENHRPKSWQFKCSECGETAYYPQRNHEKYQSGRLCGYNFCPNCGSDMRGEKE